MHTNNNKPCQWPSCPALVHAGTRYCPTHAERGNALHSTRKAQGDKAYRSTPTAKAGKDFLHTAAWLRLRVQKLSANPFCQACEANGHTTLATEVHHIKARASHPHLAMDKTNLESLCKPCHSSKTASERGQMG
jgi:5-methylcytosine-specific restriction enzyme A